MNHPLAIPTMVAVLWITLSACTIAVGRPDENRLPTVVPEDLSKVWEVYQQLQQRYVDKDGLDPEAMADAAIRGMLQELDNPFIAYLNSSDYETRVKGFGTFEGIGATVGIRDGEVTIAKPLPGSPADQAGLQPGDVILAVENESILGLSLQEVVHLIRGPRGTSVEIRVRPPNGGSPRDVTIIRDRIQHATVISEDLGDGIARVHVIQFTKETVQELREILQRLRAEGNRGIVLDLRNNPGGILGTVIQVTSEFLEDGFVMYEVDASGKRRNWKVREGGHFTDGPLAVLVNVRSASGSEVVAGALQARGRAPIVGTRTFGKGVVNIPVQLEDGSGLYIPTSMWFTPTGEQIGRHGISPDVEVVRTIDDAEKGLDPQLDAAIVLVRQALAGNSEGR